VGAVRWVVAGTDQHDQVICSTQIVWQSTRVKLIEKLTGLISFYFCSYKNQISSRVFT